MENKTPTNNGLPDCCKRKSGIKEGLLAGIIPHSGCIAIIIFALLGVTAANSFFKKYLFTQYYLYIIFGFSLTIAVISAFFYVRRFQDRNIKSHWKYLTILFSSVIAINIMMIYFIFPYAANISGNAGAEDSILKLSFEIPCSGHAPLVISELENTTGITDVRYISEKNFEVYYNPQLTTKEKILAQDICKEFNAKEA